MKKVFLGLFALGMFEASHAQKKVTFKPPVIKKDKQAVKDFNGKKVVGSPLDAPPTPPPPPPPPPIPSRAFKAPKAPPPPPPPPPLIKKQLL